MNDQPTGIDPLCELFENIFLAHFGSLGSLGAKTTAYLDIAAHHVHLFMTTVCPSSDGYLQQCNTPCHNAQIISDWLLEQDKEF